MATAPAPAPTAAPAADTQPAATPAPAPATQDDAASAPEGYAGSPWQDGWRSALEDPRHPLHHLKDT